MPDQRHFSRRAFVTAAAAGALSLALPIRLRSNGALDIFGASSQAAAPKRFTAELPIPEVLTDAELRIPMREARVPILPGKETRMWTYAGTFPGPTIRRPAGQQTQVTFVHNLPTNAGELSVHLHGGHTSSADDGQPGGLTAIQSKSFYCDISPKLSPAEAGNDLLIAPGGERTYTYELMEDGVPERAAFQWYHDHRLDRTSKNVWHGLAGMFIIDDELDNPSGPLPLPTGERDIPLLICDRSFDGDNQLTNPFPKTFPPPSDDVTGRYALVNGAYAPYHRVRAARYRLRILNASNFRAYRLYLSTGDPFAQVATEAGLMPEPVKRRRILLGPAERVEVIVDFTNRRGRDVELLSEGSDRKGVNSFGGPLMQFRVADRKAGDTTSVPATLRALPAWVEEARTRWAGDPTPDFTWRLDLFFNTWQVNGKTFDPARSDHSPVIDTTEIWRIRNRSGRAHVFHIHATDWYTLERNGAPPAPWEDCLKESFLVMPNDDVVVAGHFSDHLGKFVVHCHMLDHEDHGLMSQFEVVPATP
jgi:spore coat protein A, manganese oxidase